MNKGGRPCKEINQKEFENLCGLQCTRDEICGWFEVTDKTLEGWCKRTYGQGFSAVFAEKRGKGKISLRRSQFQLAQKSAAMAIWLGKQYLKQSDRVEVATDQKSADALNSLVAAIKAANDEDSETVKEASGDL